MKLNLTLIYFLLFLNGLMAQGSGKEGIPAGMINTVPLSQKDAAAFDQIEALELPDQYRNKALPDSIDNSRYKWFRPVFTQETYPNCMQSTSIAYNFTYEINRLRNADGADEDHQYTTHFAWNFFNGGYGWYGVNYLFTMDVLKYHGNPSVSDYGGMYYGGGERWMSGYDEWYNAMNNRISGIKKIYVGDEEGLLTLKHWLVDHLDGSLSGGVASFIACSPWNLKQLPPESPHAGKNVIPSWCPEALHGMTIVGYNDHICFDYNNDGLFTNDIDLNYDGEIDMRDWEIGALKFCNSYGDNWADEGYCYMMYKTLADEFGYGGIWTNTVHVLETKSSHDTRMTFRVELEHDYREGIRVQAGISNDLNSNQPEHIHSYSILNFQGGRHYMQGNDTTLDHRIIEFGLDVTPLLAYADEGSPCRFFLIVDEKDPDNMGYGQVRHFSLIDYQNGVEEIVCDDENVPLADNSRTILSIDYQPPATDLSITTTELPLYEAGEPMAMQLEAAGGQPPYDWKLDRNYRMNINVSAFPQIDGSLLIDDSIEDSLAMQVLEFEFPFYDGRYDTVIVSSSGYIYVDENMYFWSYIADNDYFLKHSRAIAPLLSQDIHVFEGSSQGVWYEGDEHKASFYWKNAVHENGMDELNFAVSLYPDGKIEFFYDEMILGEPIRWTAGISDGDGHSHSLPELPDPKYIDAGTHVEFLPKQQADQVMLSSDGELSILETSRARLYDVSVVLTDNSLLSTHKTFAITDALEFSLSIEGNDELRVFNGQTAYLDLIVRNRGVETIDSLKFSITTSDAQLEILDGHYDVTSLGPGETREISQAFSCLCDQQLENDQQLLLQLKAAGKDFEYEKDTYLWSQAPKMQMISFEVLNDIGLLEPGKSEDLQLTVMNLGDRKGINMLASLTSDHPGISVNTSQPVRMGNINPWSSDSVIFNVAADYSISFGSIIDFKLELRDEMGLADTMSFSMHVGRTPVYVVDLDLSIASGYKIKEVLDQMNVLSEYTQAFPSSLNTYQSVFLCLGKQFTGHSLTWSQSQILEEYLDMGGNIYMEGRVIWQQSPLPTILERFSLNTVDDPGLYVILEGVDSTFTEGLVYETDAAQTFSHYHLEPEGTAFSVLRGRQYPNPIGVAHDAGGFKTIGSIIEFGTLQSSDTCSIETLMQEMLDFFGVQQEVIGLGELPASVRHRLKNYPNPFSHHTRIPVQLDEKSTVSAGVYNLQGVKVHELSAPVSLGAGDHELVWDGTGDGGHPLPPGIYIMQVLIDGVSYTAKMVLMR